MVAPNPNFAGGYMIPKLFLRFVCGCQTVLDSLEEAKRHAEEKFHTVTITGSLAPSSVSNSNCPCLRLKSPCLQLQFACGDGFISESYEKASQHVIKTKHVLRVLGMVTPPKRSNRQKTPTIKKARCGATLPFRSTPGPRHDGGWKRKRV